jgi:hypothetical protein
VQKDAGPGKAELLLKELPERLSELLFVDDRPPMLDSQSFNHSDAIFAFNFSVWSIVAITKAV